MAGAAVVLERVLFSGSASAAATDETKVVTGHLPAARPTGSTCPSTCRAGVREIAVSNDYERPAPPSG